MKKILLAIVTLSVLIFVLSSCGVFTQPELGNTWIGKGEATITAEHDPLAPLEYSLEMTVSFGGIWDPNKVKASKDAVVLDPTVVTEERAGYTPPTYDILDGYYDPTNKTLKLNCEETTEKTKITLLGKVVNGTTINVGTIYKNVNLTGSIGTFTADKQ